MAIQDDNRQAQDHPPLIRMDQGNRSPVVWNPDATDQIADFLSYIGTQQASSLADVSDREAQRLNPYLDAWGQRIASQPPEPEKRSVLTWARSLLGKPADVPAIDFSQPGTLNTLFSASSRLTKNVILGQNAIIPQSLLEHPALLALRDSRDITSGFMPETYYNNASYGLGFIQVKKRESFNRHYDQAFGMQLKRTVSSVSFPIMTMDDGMMRHVAAHNPAKMMNALQDIITASNHDPVHHLVKAQSPNTEIVENISGSDVMADIDGQMRTYVGRYRDDHPLSYENWAISTHAATWRTLRDTPAGEDLKRAVDTYFDELQRIGGALRHDPALTEEHRQNIIDYYSTAAGFALVRLMPVNDPLIVHAIARMETLAPLPQTVVEAPRKFSPEAQAVIDLYQEGGVSFFDDTRRPASYTAAKQVQLIEMLPDVTQMNAPAAPGSDIDTARRRVNGMDRNLLNILVKPSRIGPT